MKWFRILAVTLAFAVLLTGLFGCGTKTVTFPDANLEAAIRGAIYKLEGPIYRSNLEALTTLDALGRGILDLTGLEHCVNLDWLALQANSISDISPLAGLTNLQGLSLWGNNISDISPLVENSGLAAGDSVDLSDNPLSATSVDVYIPQLEQRGVLVVY